MVSQATKDLEVAAVVQRANRNEVRARVRNPGQNKVRSLI